MVVHAKQDKWEDFYEVCQNIFTMCVNLGMIFAPCIGNIIQARKFKAKKSSEGFSLYICLITTLTNILLINFWLGKRYTIVLLFQSIVVILNQIYVVKVYLNYSIKRQIRNPNENAFVTWAKETFDITQFWRWESFSPYIVAVIFFIGISLLITYLIGVHNKEYIESVGFIALGIQVFIGIPQIISNVKSKNVANISIIMVSLWIFGDSFKTGYYVITKCPFQFIFFSAVQLILNISLLIQIIYYNTEKNIFEGEGLFMENQRLTMSNECKKDYSTITSDSDKQDETGISQDE